MRSSSAAWGVRSAPSFEGYEPAPHIRFVPAEVAIWMPVLDLCREVGLELMSSSVGREGAHGSKERVIGAVGLCKHCLERIVLRPFVDPRVDRIVFFVTQLPDDVPKTIDRAETLVFEIAQHRQTDSMSRLHELLDQTVDSLEAL